MTEMDILIDTLIQKQNSILNKAQIVDKKAEIYKLSEKGDVIEQLITAYIVMEEELDSSIESFEKTEEAVKNAWTKIKNQTLEAWESISQKYEEVEETERQAKLDEKLDRLELQKDDFDSDLSFVELEISFYEPSGDYTIDYSIEESNNVNRGGKMIFNPFSSNKTVLASKATKLIGKYKEELHGGEKIEYKGFM
ncbi:hypothetical protein [Planococcus halocryophilus]|uniref:hypothetical protein n=1 Tax=Planococcus halocryophilus TaxID=1215089 RepID=UPI001F10266F|nr:hypothetical protein [Planococcus halocryophilus]MCH4825763.1 hypothetical protein [Planococcus halocryophilus]